MMDLSSLSDNELRELKKKTEYEVAKFNGLQAAKKCCLNSAYGVLGNQYFRLYDVRLASAVTLSGQLVIRWIERAINEEMNAMLKTVGVDYVVAADTDSLYINLGKVVELAYGKQDIDADSALKIISSFCKQKIEPLLAKHFELLATHTNAFDQKMHMKQEAVATKALWQGTKRYICDVLVSEGARLASPDLKMVGIEAIRSSTPEVCRKMIKKVLEMTMRGSQEEVIDAIDKFSIEFMSLPVEAIASPRSVSDLRKYHDSASIYQKGTPIAVKAALVHNHLLRELDLEHVYQPINEGEKVKYIILREPNPVHSTAIGFIDVLPEEFGLHDYVDKWEQFQKTFLAPLDAILQVMGWSTTKKASIADFAVF